MANTAGRTEKATTTGTATNIEANASQGTRPSPDTTALPPSHANSPSSSAPPTIPAGDRYTRSLYTGSSGFDAEAATTGACSAFGVPEAVPASARFRAADGCSGSGDD